MKRFLSLLFVLGIVLFCSIPSCAISSQEEYAPCPKCLMIYIDDSFPEKHQTMIKDSIKDWQEKTNNTLTISIQNKSIEQMNNGQHPGIINIFNEIPPNNYWGWTWGTDKSKIIMLLISIDDADFLPTVKHELGHAFNLPHYYGPDLSIMGVPPYHQNEISCTDIMDFCQIWSCDVPCK